MNFLLVSLIAAATVAVAQVVTFGLALRLGRHCIVDVTWGLGFPLLAATGWVVGARDGRADLILLLTAAWGLRLAGHLARRQRADPSEDRRYRAVLERADARGIDRRWYAATRIYLTQGLSMWFVSLPVQVVLAQGGEVGWWGWAGVLLWTFGLSFEAIGDHQLSAFRRSPSSGVLDTGLWAWTRHPNYFGDACVWWGLWVIAAAHWPGALTVASPALMTWLLARGTGAALLERDIGQRRPGYADYVRRTSGFLPRRPRHAGPDDGRGGR